MISIDSLNKVANGLKNAVAEMNAINDRVNRKIDELEKDTSRSQIYKAEQIKTAREQALPKMLDSLRTMRDTAANSTPHRELWKDRDLLWSQLPFDSDKAIDAQIRVRYAAELPGLSQVLLAATMKNALLDNNLALAWACEMARRRAGFEVLVDLTEVVIPGQAAALAAFAACDTALVEAELLVAATSGVKMTPTQKLTLGHRLPPRPPRDLPGHPAPRLGTTLK